MIPPQQRQGEVNDVEQPNSVYCSHKAKRLTQKAKGQACQICAH